MSSFSWAALSRASPLGPIFAKELRVTSRRRRTYMLRVAYLSILMLTLVLAWTEVRTVTAGSVAARVQAQARLGTSFFAAFSLFSITAMAVIGPVLTSTAIGAEKLAKTLPVLLMTPISAWQIAAGKLFSRLLIALSLLALSLPVLAVVRLLGGVELAQVLVVLGLCVSTVIFTAGNGLLLSTFMTRSYAVILLSYVILFVAYAAIPLLIVLYSSSTMVARWQIIPAINPFAAVVMLLESRSARAGLGTGTSLTCMGAHLGFGALFLATTALMLRRAARDKAMRDAAAAEPPAAAVAPSAETDQVTEASPRRRRARRRAIKGEVGDRPVLWHESRRPLMAGRWQAAIGLLLFIGVMLAIYVGMHNEDLLDNAGSQIGFAIVFNGLSWLFLAVLSASAIAQEKDSDTWTLLLTTPLSGKAIVWGKVAGVLRRAMWPAAIVSLHFLIFTIAGVIDVSALILILWVMFSFNSIWIATGIYLSLRLTRVAAAVAVNLLLAVALYALTPMVLAVLEALVNRDASSTLPQQTLWYLPYFYLGTYVSSYERSYTPRLRFPDGTQVSAATFWITTIIVGAIYLLLAAGLLAWVARRFDRIVGRAQTNGPPEPLGGTPALAASA